jgi:hypothetical protein
VLGAAPCGSTFGLRIIDPKSLLLAAVAKAWRRVCSPYLWCDLGTALERLSGRLGALP